MSESIVPMKKVIPDLVNYLCNPPESIKLPSWSNFNDIVGGFRAKEFTILCGSTGCLSGDTMISIHRAGKGSKMSIRDLYLNHSGIGELKFDKKINTYVRSYDGISIRLHKVKDVFLSGIKETRRIKTTQHKEIRLTPCHKVLTRRGWIRSENLIVGDFLAMDTPKPRKRKIQKAKTYDSYFGRIKYHPYATKCNDEKRLVNHRAIYESNLNNLSIDFYLSEIRTNPKSLDIYNFIDPREFHIHHKDHDHYNNDLSNLEVLSVEDHLEHHGDYKNFNQGQIHWVRYLGFDKIGIEAVYDIECEDPHHNFVANGLVVHNSGKTSFLSNMSAELLNAKIKHFVMSVETGHMDYLARVLSVIVNEDLNTGDAIPKEKLLRIGVNNHEKLFSDYIELSLYDNRIPLDELLGNLAWAVENKCKIAFIDNLNFFLDITEDSSMNKEMDRVTHALIMFCKRNPIHIILVMHPKKTTQGTRVLNEFDIKGSSTAVQEANNIFLFNRPDPKRIEDGDSQYTDRELLIAKMRRRGKYAGRTLVFNGKFPKYAEMGCLHDVHRDEPKSAPEVKAIKPRFLPPTDGVYD